MVNLPREEAHTHGETDFGRFAAHELGLAATFGGIVFGQSRARQGGEGAAQRDDRSRVLEAVVGAFAIPKAIGVITAGATWLVGRSIFSGRFMGRDIRGWCSPRTSPSASPSSPASAPRWSGGSSRTSSPSPCEAEGKPAPGTPPEKAAGSSWTVTGPGLHPARRGRHDPGPDVRPEHPRAEKPALESHRAVAAIAWRGRDGYPLVAVTWDGARIRSSIARAGLRRLRSGGDAHICSFPRNLHARTMR